MKLRKKTLILPVVALSLFLSLNFLSIKSYANDVDETGRVYNIVDGVTVDVLNIRLIHNIIHLKEQD